MKNSRCVPKLCDRGFFLKDGECIKQSTFDRQQFSSSYGDPHFFIHSSTAADLCFDLNVPENSTITLLEDKLTHYAIEGTIFAPFSGNKKYFSNFIIKNGSEKIV